MKIESTKGSVEVSTIEEATRWLEEMQPSHASIDGHDIESPSGEWTDENATPRVAAAMADGDWYWIDGSAYCPACIHCDSPAIDADDLLVQRGHGVARCTCCRAEYDLDGEGTSEIESHLGDSLCSAENPCGALAYYDLGEQLPWRIADDHTAESFGTLKEAIAGAKAWRQAMENA